MNNIILIAPHEDNDIHSTTSYPMLSLYTIVASILHGYNHLHVLQLIYNTIVAK